MRTDEDTIALVRRLAALYPDTARLAPSHEVAQPPDDPPGPQCLFGRLAHDFPDLAVDRVSVLPDQKRRAALMELVAAVRG